jgi:hypothetical protein
MAQTVLVDFTESMVTHSKQIDVDYKEFIDIVKGISLVQHRAERWSQAAYVLNGHTFTWACMVLDFLTRYVVIPQVGAMEPDADAALVMKTELEAGLQKARKKRKKLESKLDLPDDGRIKFLSAPQD